MRKIVLAAAALALVAGGVMLLGSRGAPQWTTDSAEALAEFEKGLDATMKFYHADAVESFDRALELDPDFAAAKLYLSQTRFDKQAREDLLADLRQTDLEGLTEREGFLVRHRLARADEGRESAEDLLATYLDEHPRDPYALALRCNEAWVDQDWKAAEGAYRRLLEVDPNWVSAQNHLGYLAMAQGNFEEAEELFETYKFIAPDQANPHDSLGEMLTILGRYDEARRSFEEALRIKPDFCASYDHLFDLFVLEGRPETILPLLEKADPECRERDKNAACRVQLWQFFFADDFYSPFAPEFAGCLESLGDVDFLIHRLAVFGGRTAVALEIENSVAQGLARPSGMPEMERQFLQALYLHLQGVRKMAEGDDPAAARMLREADSNLHYWGRGQGTLKLYNRLNLAVALARSGDAAGERAMFEEIRRVNPKFAELYPHALESVGAGR